MIVWLSALVIAATVPGGPPDDPRARGYLGVLIAPDDSASLVVTEAMPGTPAQRGGLRPGDVLVQVGQIRPKTFDEMRLHIESFRPGTALRFELLRPSPEGKPPTNLVVTVRLMARPPSADAGLALPPE